MAIPGPGVAISMNTIAGEFGGTVPHSLSEYYRGGGLVPNVPQNAAIPTSGAIPMGSFYGATNRVSVPITIAANTYNYDVYTAATPNPAYVAGISDVIVTVNPGVTVGSTSTGAYAMLVPSAFNPADQVTIVNNGVIQGMGGNGGPGGPGNGGGGAPGGAGGNAIYVNRPTTITNNSVIAGGGGGGSGGAGAGGPAKSLRRGGGGGGGGAGFNGGDGGTGGTTFGGGPAAAPGGSGTSTTGGSGGSSPQTNQAGGPGGGRGAAGSNSAGSGGAAGNYIVGNPFVTWPATGTRQGGVA